VTQRATDGLCGPLGTPPRVPTATLVPLSSPHRYLPTRHHLWRLAAPSPPRHSHLTTLSTMPLPHHKFFVVTPLPPTPPVTHGSGGASAASPSRQATAHRRVVVAAPYLS
jgi:hypothetical protein